MPEVRGTTDFNGGAYPPSKRPHHFLLRTDGQRPIVNTERRGHRCASVILMQFVAEGVVYAVGPVRVVMVRPSRSAPNANYHLLGW